MADLLTENVLPVLGLCPPGSLLLPWLAQARAGDGRPLGLPQKVSAATFAVARRLGGGQKDGKADGPPKAPVAAVLLEEEAAGGRPAQATLVMMDWTEHLSPASAAALQRVEPRQVFGVDVALKRRCLLALSPDDALPLSLLRELTRRCGLTPEEVGWLGLRSLAEVLFGYLERLPQERWRAPERTALDLLQRLQQSGRGPMQPVRPPHREVLALLAEFPLRRRPYEPYRPGSVESPFRFQLHDDIETQAEVLGARLLQRRELRQRAEAAKPVNEAGSKS